MTMIKGYGFFPAVVTLLILACQSANQTPIETFKVKRGEFLTSITETGELAAVNSQMINAPSIDWRFGTLKVTKIVDDGEEVDSGKVLVEFDKADVEKGIIDTKAELEIAQAELRKVQAQQASQIEGLEADLERTRLQHRISELNLEKAVYESEIRRKEIELELEKASISLQKAEKEIENQKLVNREDISKLELQVRQAASRLQEAYATLEKLTVTSPAPGIAIIEENRATDLKVALDDQVFPGWPLISLPDLRLMKAEVPINEIDIAKIAVGQEAHIRLDAFPDTSFHGAVTEMANLARAKDSSSRVKVFDVVVTLDENGVELMPGMTVSCEIIISRLADTLFVPLEALFFNEGGRFVYVKKGGSFEPRPVVTGDENQDFVIITEGLKEGEEVALSDPTIGEKTKEKKKEGKAS
jgi:HlyD family secretion protein